MTLSLVQSIARLQTDSDLFHAITHGPATGPGSDVPTEGGPVSTAAKAIQAVRTVSDAAIGAINQASQAAIDDLQRQAGSNQDAITAAYAAAVAEVQRASNAAIAAIQAQIRATGYQVPVAYTTGIAMTAVNQTVSYSGSVYAPLDSALPFTTSGTFEASKFRLLQGVVAADLADAATGAAHVGYGGVTVKAFLDALCASGDTRPTPLFVGQPFFDTTLGYTIRAKQLSPAIWVNEMGVELQ